VNTKRSTGNNMGIKTHMTSLVKETYREGFING
jgi:hypothetical protein